MVRLLKSPFQHVYAIKQSPGGAFWIVIDPKASHTDVNILPVDQYPHIRLLVKDDDVVVTVKAEIKEKDRHTLCIINCVEIVKSLLGIRNFWMWTPRQLYNYLVRCGK